MIVVSNTSPIRALAHLAALDLLGQLFQKVLIPPAVAEELLRPRANLPNIDEGVDVAAVDNRAVVARLEQILDSGEAEAIALAIERHV